MDQLWHLLCAEFRVGELDEQGLALVCVCFCFASILNHLTKDTLYVFSLYIICHSSPFDTVLISLSPIQADPVYEATR